MVHDHDGRATLRRSFTERISTFPSLEPLKKRPVLPKHSRIASESLIASDTSGLYKGQVVGAGSGSTAHTTYLNHDDINRRAIQILHLEGADDETVTSRDTFHCILRIIHPYDRFRRTFDLATVAWVLLLVFWIPLEIGFVWYEPPDAQKIISVVLDVWFALDILLNFRTGYVHHGTVVMDPKKIASNYLSSWFLVDVLGTVPFEQLISAGNISSRKSIKLVKYFKIPKLLRVSRVMKYVRNHKYVYDFSKILLVIFTLLHIGACVWVMTLDPCDETKSNFAGLDVCSQENVYNVYAEALHISATMFLGVSNFHILGKPQMINLDFEGRQEDTTKMYLISTLFMIVGLFLIALLMSETNVYVMGKMQGSAAFQRRTDRVNHEMEYYGVPDDLQRQVRAFYDYVWIHQKQYDEKIALLSDQQMSTDLQRKLALHLFKDVVSHISFFSEIDDLLLGEICMSLRTRIYLPGDMILFKGDVGKELFIISKGVVEVLRDDLPAAKRRNAPRILLRNGSFFGEIALVMEVRRTCSVQARTVCEVNILQQDAFDAVVRENPHFARRMNELIVARQLDSCIASSQQKGVDFQVSQVDLDLAVQAMERNMKEGLKRREKDSGTLGTSGTLSDSSHKSCLRHDSDQGSKATSHRVSFEAVPVVDGAQNNTIHSTEPRQGHTPVKGIDEESQLTMAGEHRSSSGSEIPVSDVIRDVARRSTRFTQQFPNKTRIERTRPLSAPAPDEESDSDDNVCSDGEMYRRFHGRKSSAVTKAIEASERMGNASIDDLDSRLTGTFTPGKCVIDPDKIRAVILNNQQEEPRRKDTIKTLSERLSQQGRLMQQMMSKIDRMEVKGKSDESKEREAGG